MDMPSKRARGWGLAVLLTTAALQGCWSNSFLNLKDPRRAYIAQMEFELRPQRSLSDPRKLAVALQALPDVIDTMWTLTSERMTEAAMVARIGWAGPQPLRIAAEDERKPAALDDPTRLRIGFSCLGAAAWTVERADAVSVVVRFWDFGALRERREHQTYQRRGDRWMLVKQERL